MYEWVKKIHMYAGLLTFTAFVVWGVTGIHAVFLAPPGGYVPPENSTVSTASKRNEVMAGLSCASPVSW